jgi:Predicted metal-dependent hydrolase of the TIM-barrel fold
VIDAHVHFWDPDALSYPWLEAAPVLRRAFLPTDYAPLTDGAVTGVVVVESDCAPPTA